MAFIQLLILIVMKNKCSHKIFVCYEFTEQLTENLEGDACQPGTHLSPTPCGFSLKHKQMTWGEETESVQESLASDLTGLGVVQP